jgi:hypothetical protein
MAPAGISKSSMASAPAQASTKAAKRPNDRQVHLEQLRNVELLNGRVAMLGIVIGVVVEGADRIRHPPADRSGCVGEWLQRLPHPVPALLLLISADSDHRLSIEGAAVAADLDQGTVDRLGVGLATVH